MGLVHWRRAALAGLFCACAVNGLAHGEMEYNLAQPPPHTNVRSPYLEHCYRVLSDLALRFPTRSQSEALQTAEAIYQVVWAWRSSPVSSDEMRSLQHRLTVFWSRLEREYPTVRATLYEGRVAYSAPRPFPVARGLERCMLLRLDYGGTGERSVVVRIGQTDIGSVTLPADNRGPERTRWIIVPLLAGERGRSTVSIEIRTEQHSDRSPALPSGNGSDRTAAASSRMVIVVPVTCEEPAIVRGTILDAQTGKPWPGRVHVRGSDGLIRHGESFKDNETLSEKPVVFRPASYKLPFFYSDGSFEVRIPPGATEIALERGFEWPIARKRLRLSPGEVRQVTLETQRALDMSRLGWISGDTHVHWVRNRWDVNESLDLLGMVQRAEDIRVINNLTLYQWRAREQGGTFIKPDHHPMGPVPGMCDGYWHVQMAEEYRNDNHYGHINLLGLNRLIEPIATGAGSGGPIGAPDWPTNRPTILEARRQGGISIEAHNIGPYNASAVPVRVALGLADSLDQLDADHYHRFLNCGFHIGLSNGSDHPARVVGCARVYARLARRDGRPLTFTYRRWLDAVRRGRTFTTSGPLLLLKVNEAEPGDTLDVRAGDKLNLEVTAWSRYPLGMVEIVSNGEVLRSVRTTARTCTLRLNLAARESRWFCARASRSGEWNAILAPDVAHTSAVYVRVGGREVIKPEAALGWAANVQEHIRRLEALGVFERDEHRDQALAEAREGLQRYRELAERPSRTTERARPSDRCHQSRSSIRLIPMVVDRPLHRQAGMHDGQDLSRIALHIQAPWMTGPVELRFPETLRSSLGMHFLDHYLSSIQPLSEWDRFPDWESDPRTGGVSYDYLTPEGLQVSASATPHGDTVELTFAATNRTGRVIERVEANCCLDLGPCPELNARWDLKRLFMSFGGTLKPLSTTTPTPEQMGRQPWLLILTERGAPTSVLPRVSPTWWRIDQLTDRNLMAATTADGKHLLGYTWSVEPEALMTNCGNPCLHTGTGFSPRLGPGESFTWHGRIYMLKNDPAELLRRYEEDCRTTGSHGL